MDTNITFLELYEAYLDCRRHKRNTINALGFELNYEEELVRLLDEINSNTYRVGRSVSFIVNQPVKREIFAADFRDRVVHHLVVNKILAILERRFILDSYSCRKGKGTHFGITHIAKFIRSCSQNYSTNCYILKMDIEGFFMHINRNILWENVESIVQSSYVHQDKDKLLNLLSLIVHNNPTENCIVKGTGNDWKGLPKSKSLFFSPLSCGLPIGNLTSQVFANLYLNAFDHFVKSTLGVQYVDDFIIVHEDKDYLKGIVPQIKAFLKEELGLDLHPKKVYLQHYTKGVKFIGAVIKPYRLYVQNRTKSNVYKSIVGYNEIVNVRRPSVPEVDRFISSINSYFGLMGHFNTYKLRKKIFRANISGYWYNHVYSSGGYAKLVKKKKPLKLYCCSYSSRC